MAERELSLDLSENAKDLLVEKGWDPAMGARPLRRPIQRYIEDPLADEVLRQNVDPSSTVQTDTKDGDSDGNEPEVTVKITAPKRKKREPLGVGVGGEGGGGGDEPESRGDGDGDGGEGLPDEPEVVPDVPNAPPHGDGGSDGPRGDG